LEIPELSYNEWKGVVKLATKWGMSKLRRHCIEELSPLPDSMAVPTKIIFARECLAVEWLVNAYNELARRKEMITKEEALIIGLETAFRISCLREEWFQDLEKTDSSGGSITYYPSQRNSHDYRPAIQVMFRDEITRLGNAGRTAEYNRTSKKKKKSNKY
jgi:hypothetical protein